MMPQRETSESIYEHADPTYGRYEGNQATAHQFDERADAPPLEDVRGEKMYPVLHDHKNAFRLGMFVIAMVTLLLCAVLFVFFLGGTGGWVSFIVAAFAIFLVTVVAIDKIQ